MNSAKNTVLVTGATGFLGGAVARRLAADGAHVRALARSPEKAAYVLNVANIEIIQGDITNTDQVRDSVRGCEVVFHLAVSYGSWEQQRRVNVEGTRALLKAAADAGARRFIYCSSIVVYGYTRSGHITESDILLPSLHDPYSVTKIMAEDLVREFGAARGLSYTIIRPGMIYGPRSGMWTDTVFQYARRKPVLWIGDGSGSIFPVHVDDVADMIAVAAVHPAAHNQAFNCVGEESVTWREYIMRFARLAGHQQYVGVPAPLLDAVAQVISPLASGQLRAAPELVKALTRKAFIDMSKAHDLLGWRPRYDLDSGIETVVLYLRKKGWLN